jgi:hypothetical protein
VSSASAEAGAPVPTSSSAPPAVLPLAEVRLERKLPLDTVVSKSDGTIRYDYGKLVATAFEDGRIVDAYGKELARVLADGTIQGVTQEPLRLEPDGDAVGGSSGVRVHVDDGGNAVVGGRVVDGIVVRWASSPPSPASHRFAVMMLLAGAPLFGGGLEKTLFDDPQCEHFGAIGLSGTWCKCKRELGGRSYALSCADGTSPSCTCSEGGREAPARPEKAGVCHDVVQAWGACGFPGRRLRASKEGN